MDYSIVKIEGIGAAYGQKLQGARIRRTSELLAQCGSAKGRKSVAAQTGLDEKQLLKWVNMADLMRISGIGEEYSELLEAAGVDTVKELRNRKADNLATRMAEVNQAKKPTRQVPSARQVGRWIEQAKLLEPMVTH